MTRFTNDPSHRSPGYRTRHPSEPDHAADGLPSVDAVPDLVVEGLLYALLVFTPLAFGGAAAWAQEVFLALAGAAAVVVAVKHVGRAWAGRGGGYRWSWAYPVMLLFLALCAAQAVPLPAAWVTAVSPATVKVKADLLSDLPGAADALRRPTVSFYPHATVRQTALAAAAAALFAVVLDVFREPARIRRLLSVVAGMGLVVAGMAVYQNLTGSTTIYGVQPAGHPNSGPFLNYSHFSQFMNLSIGAALALLLDRLAELTEYYRSPHELRAALVAPRNAALWAWAGLCVLGPVTVMLSMSRMGMISTAVATVVTGGALLWRGRSSTLAGGGGGNRAWLLVGLGLTVFAVILGVGFDVVSARLATVQDLRTTGRRDEMLRDMVAEFKRFPVVGTGLGTHEFVFGMYDRRNLASRATHAENEYAQLMEETGGVGVALAAAFVAVVAVSYARATRRPADPIDFVPFGLGFGLVAILAHSGTDFGQHVPANAALTAVFAGLLGSLARRRRPAGPPAPAGQGPTPPRRALPVVGTTAVLVAAVAAVSVVLPPADRARDAASLAETAVGRANGLAARNWRGTDADYADLLEPAAAAVARDPGDVVNRYWADTYRWHALDRAGDTAGGTVATLPAAARPAARAIVDDLDAGRVLCPTFGPALSVAGQINHDVLGRGDVGERQIQLSYQLAPYDPLVCLVAGLDAVADHRWDEAERVLGRYAAQGGGVADYADACIAAGKGGIPYRLVRGDRGGLTYLADRMPVDHRWDAWRDRCRSDAAKLLAADAAKPDAPAEVLAEQAAADQRQGRSADAAGLYRRAVTDEYSNVGWRLALAQCLADAGHPADAATEAEVCMRLRPDLPDARAFLDRLHRRELDASPATAP